MAASHAKAGGPLRSSRPPALSRASVGRSSSIMPTLPTLPSLPSTRSSSAAASRSSSSAAAPPSSTSSSPSTGPKRGSGLFSAPQKWLQSYDNFITKNLSQVSQIESALRSLTYIIPGRFRDAEIASEAIYSGVQLLSLYHDLLLQRTPLPIPSPSASSSSSSSRPLPEALQAPSQHTRYTRYWIQKSPFYRRVAIVLQIVRYTELLCEMAAKRRGQKMRWRVVVLIEAVKAVCRLLLLRVTRGRTLVSPPMPVRQPLPEADDEDDEDIAEYDEDEEEEEEEVAEDAKSIDQPMPVTPQKTTPQPSLSPPPSPLPTKAMTATTPPRPGTAGAVGNFPPSPAPTLRQPSPPLLSPADLKHGWPMPRTGMSLPPLPQAGDISSYLQARVLTADDIKPATKLLNQLRGSGRVAEILHILAPLVYALALARTAQKGGRAASSWKPWLAGLAMELAARQLRDQDSLRTTTLEREEWTRRGWAMGWWSLRGAFYEHAMKGVVAGVRSRLPNFVGGIVEDYEYLWENYYFSSSP